MAFSCFRLGCGTLKRQPSSLVLLGCLLLVFLFGVVLVRLILLLRFFLGLVLALFLGVLHARNAKIGCMITDLITQKSPNTLDTAVSRQVTSVSASASPGTAPSLLALPSPAAGSDVKTRAHGSRRGGTFTKTLAHLIEHSSRGPPLLGTTCDL